MDCTMMIQGDCSALAGSCKFPNPKGYQYDLIRSSMLAARICNGHGSIPKPFGFPTKADDGSMAEQSRFRNKSSVIKSLLTFYAFKVRIDHHSVFHLSSWMEVNGLAHRYPTTPMVQQCLQNKPNMP